MRIFLKYCLCTTTAVVDGDYVPVSGQIIQFNRGDVTQTQTVLVNDDDECEKDPSEIFFSNIALDSGIPDIIVVVPQTTVTINDADEICGKSLGVTLLPSVDIASLCLSRLKHLSHK